MREVLTLVKAKLRGDMRTACGLMWSDSNDAMTVDEESTNPSPNPNARYAVNDRPRMTTKYAVGEEDGSLDL